MTAGLTLQTSDPRAVELRCGELVLLRYVFLPETVAEESPRPYAHPVRTLAGAELTNFRPNDHPWHHGLSFTINGASGVNFWGGPTYRRDEGYRWRADHGRQQHIAWDECTERRLVERVDWIAGSNEERLLAERRVLTPALVSATSWTLRWQATLENVSGRPLVLGNYHSSEGLAGSHYTGLQFRGARDLLDEHGDATVGIFAEGERQGEAAVHGAPARWMEWRGQKDTTLQRVAVRFENAKEPLHWFLRRGNPLAALPFQFDRDLELPPGGRLAVDHLLTFSDL